MSTFAWISNCVLSIRDSKQINILQNFLQIIEKKDINLNFHDTIKCSVEQG